MLGRAAGVDPEFVLERADGTLAVAEQLQDPDPRRMPSVRNSAAFVT